MMAQDGRSLGFGMEFLCLSDRGKGERERARDVMADSFVQAL